MRSPERARTDVFVGVDVGKSAHHVVALSADGVKLLDRSCSQDQGRLVELIDELRGQGRVLFVVDQPATISALPVAVARSMGVEVSYLPGLAMRRIAEIHAGEAKTDARDAAVIAEAARSMPHALRSLRKDDEGIAELAMLSGFGEDLAFQVNQVSNRIRGLLTQIHPALKRVIGAHLRLDAIVELPARYPSLEAIRSWERSRLAVQLKKLSPRIGDRLAEEIWAALGEQTVIVAGTDAAAEVLSRLAEQLLVLRRQRTEIADKVEGVAAEHPPSEVLIFMPGIGVRTAAQIIVEVASRHFASAGHLASYASLAPVTHRSGTSIRGERRPQRRNRRPKRALYLSAFAALKDPASRDYYRRKRAQARPTN